jgi:hypothetical protein
MMASTPFYCCDHSRAVGEPLIGTAPRADVWVALEYDGAWGNKTPDDSDLSPAIKACINAWTAAIPNLKFSFIRRHSEEDSPSQGKKRLYVARMLEMSPELYQLDLDAPEDVLSVDMAGLALGAPEFAEHLTDSTLYMVCINGRRDIACARYGVPMFEALRAEAGVGVWGSTHIGGHRFAATLAVLPEGSVYGYLEADDAHELVTHQRMGRLLRSRLRGRTCYSASVQAAEHFLRQHHDIDELPGVRLLGVQQPAEGRWQVRFEMLRFGMVAAVTVEQQPAPMEVYRDSSGQPAPIDTFALVSIV